MQEILTSRGTRIQVIPAPEHTKNGATLHITSDNEDDGRVVNLFLTEREMLELGKGLVLESVRVFERGENTDFNETT